MSHKSPTEPLLSPEAEARYQEVRKERRAKRAALLARLEEEDAEDLAKRLRKCGQPLRLHCVNCGHVKEVETRCDIKWCPACQYALSTANMKRYEKLCEEADYPLFATLTVKNYDQPSVRPLRRAWGKLRRLRWFRRCVRGGVVSFECTNTGKGWHWHCHALLDCKWLSVSVPEPGPRAPETKWRAQAKAALLEVAQQWELCTERKASVKVRRVWRNDGGDIGKAVAEVLKYSVKGSDMIDCPDKVAPFLRLLNGTRLITSFGTFFGKAPKEKKRPALPCDCGCRERVPEEAVEFLMRPPKGTKRHRTAGPF